MGYRMTLVKNPEFFNEAEVSRMIEQTLPSVKMDSDTATEKSYVLEHKTSKKFRDLFEKLEGMIFSFEVCFHQVYLFFVDYLTRFVVYCRMLEEFLFNFFCNALFLFYFLFTIVFVQNIRMNSVS